MARIDLSISVGYVSDWGIREGVREIMQNAIDAHADNFPMGFDYDKEKRRIKIWSDGALLEKKTLLLGETTKADRDNQVGKFGEGYKLGVLALVRCGKEVEIHNGVAGETWHPSIRFSKVLNGEVLSFDIRSSFRKSKSEKLEFRVGNVSADEWVSICKLFRFTSDAKPVAVFHTPDGDILEGVNVAGNLYVSGIFIQNNPGFMYGYDFRPNKVVIDRDRKMVQSYSLEERTGMMWNHLAASDPAHLKRVEDMCKHNVRDVTDFRYQLSSNEAVRMNLLERFKETFGHGAVPVFSEEERVKMEGAGLKPILAGEIYSRIIRNEMGGDDKIIAGFQSAIVDSAPVLSEEEAKNLQYVCRILNIASLRNTGIGFADVKAVKFQGSNLHSNVGTYDDEKRVIYLATWALRSPGVALSVVLMRQGMILNGYGSSAFEGRRVSEQDVSSIASRVVAALYEELLEMGGSIEEHNNDVAVEVHDGGSEIVADVCNDAVQ